MFTCHRGGDVVVMAAVIQLLPDACVFYHGYCQILILSLIHSWASTQQHWNLTIIEINPFNQSINQSNPLF